MAVVTDIKTKNQKGKSEYDGLFLLSRGKRSERFLTNDSHRYRLANANTSRRVERMSQMDSVLYRHHRQTIKPSSWQYTQWQIQRSWLGWRYRIVDSVSGVSFSLSPARAWNFSLVGAMLFGMISMSMIYRSFGQTTFAGKSVPIDGEVAQEVALSEDDANVLGEAIEFIQKSEADQLLKMREQREQEERVRALQEQKRQQEQSVFQERVREMVKGYPIEEMLPVIFEQDEIIASYLVAIAKKESNWGRRVPVLNGEDCYNYWGYRAVRDRMGSGGHTCFDDRRDAVETVGARIAWFVQQKGRETPEELVVWKCGYSCAGHSDYSVQKWISDVDLYFSKLYQKNEKSTPAY